MKIHFLFISFACFYYCQAYHSIDDYGAIANDSSNAAGHANSMAIINAMNAANQNATDRTVLIPSGKVYNSFNVSFENLVNVTLQIDGTFVASNDIGEWEKIFGNPPPFPEVHIGIFSVWNSIGFTLTGKGIIDGQGYDWWIFVWTNNTHADHRPFFVHMYHCKDVEISGLLIKNSPFWNLNLEDMSDVHIHDIDIHVDIDRQKSLLISAGKWNDELNLPTFPLNTDGVDPSGQNFLIENVKMDLFDDAVAVKPSNSAPGRYSNCSQNMMIRNVTTLFTVGMAIGSLTNDPLVNCIRNITFEDITMYLPLKGIHVKTNPDESNGTGIIDSITYRNMNLLGSVWMPIYIGPQQEQQPGQGSEGCSWFYPIVDQCATNPAVQISNILLENVTLVDSLLWPGVINCDKDRKCLNMRFINVYSAGLYIIQPIYECHHAEGVKINSNYLPLLCMDSGLENGSMFEEKKTDVKVDIKSEVKKHFPNVPEIDIGQRDVEKLKKLMSSRDYY